MDAAGRAAMVEKLNRILGAVLEQRGLTDEASRMVMAVKRDFTLLVHTVSGHLEESRLRSAQLEGMMAELKSSLASIARHVGAPVSGA